MNVDVSSVELLQPPRRALCLAPLVGWVVLVGALAGCGGPRYVVARPLVAQLSPLEQAALLPFEAAIAEARLGLARATSGLDLASREVDVSRAAYAAAKAEVDRAAQQVELRRQAGDSIGEALARRERELARLSRKAADLKLDCATRRRRQAAASIVVAELFERSAMARLELERARHVYALGLLGPKGPTLADFEEESLARDRRLSAAMTVVDVQRQRAEALEREWQLALEEVRLFALRSQER
jgi:hypothetical protein